MRTGIVALLVLLVPGCVVVDVTSPDGTKVQVARLLTDTGIKSMEVKRADGTTFTITGYNSNVNVEALGEVAERTATGVAKGLKP